MAPGSEVSGGDLVTGAASPWRQGASQNPSLEGSRCGVAPARSAATVSKGARSWPRSCRSCWWVNRLPSRRLCPGSRKAVGMCGILALQRLGSRLSPPSHGVGGSRAAPQSGRCHGAPGACREQSLLEGPQGGLLSASRTWPVPHPVPHCREQSLPLQGRKTGAICTADPSRGLPLRPRST